MHKEKYGFIYIWYDRKYKKYYIGSHWGTEFDGYICSSKMMRQSYNRRKEDFRRKIIKKIYTNQKDLLIEEEYWLSLIDPNKTTPHNSTTKSRENVRYYNIKLGTQNQWWSNDDKRLTVGEKISAKKKGKKTGPRDPSIGKAISEAKKKKFAERGGMTEEHKNALKGKKKPHTEEWKAINSLRMKEQWSNGSRERAKPKQTMSRTKQDEFCSEQLKNRWSNPEWKENQRLKLKEAWIKRKQNINMQKAL